MSNSVLVRISAEIVTPSPDRKFDGVFQINTELSPIASPAFETNSRPTETEILLGRILEKTIRRSGALDTESLCIIAGAKCWSVRADVHVLVHDGGLVDASCIATVAALRHFRRPDTEVRGGTEVVVYSVREREPVPLSMQLVPFAVSLSLFGLREEDAAAVGSSEEAVVVVVVDATLDEERARDASIVISLDRHGQVCQIAKYGGLAVDPDVVQQCTGLALKKVEDISRSVQTALNEDAKARVVPGLMAELRAENER